MFNLRSTTLLTYRSTDVAVGPLDGNQACPSAMLMIGWDLTNARGVGCPSGGHMPMHFALQPLERREPQSLKAKIRELSLSVSSVE